MAVLVQCARHQKVNVRVYMSYVQITSTECVVYTLCYRGMVVQEVVYIIVPVVSPYNLLCATK